MELEKNHHKVLISTTSRLVGTFQSKVFSIHHSWPQVRKSNFDSRMTEGPASRNSFIIFFQDPNNDPEKVEFDKFYHAGEIVTSWISVLFGKRFDNHGLTEGGGYFRLPNLHNYQSLNDHRAHYNSHSSRVDFEIPLNLQEVKRLEFGLDALFDIDKHRISEEALSIFTTASGFYKQSLQVVAEHPETAYLHLISAVELLSGFYEYEELSFLDSGIQELLGKVESTFTDKQSRGALKSMKSMLRSIKRKFCQTIYNHISDEFFQSSESSHPLGKLTEDSFERRVRSAYDLRSKHLHTGVSFGGWIDERNREEIQLGVPVVNDKEFKKILKWAPTFRGLERIVRFVMIDFGISQGIINGFRKSKESQKPQRSKIIFPQEIGQIHIECGKQELNTRIAREIWRKEGKPEGDSLQHWLIGEDIIENCLDID